MFIDEYEQMAIDFLKATGTRLEITAKRNVNGTPKKSKMTGGNEYYCKLRRGHKTYSFTFNDSIHNRVEHIRPTKYDVLACLETWDYLENFDDFMWEFGYDNDEHARSVYKACMKQSEKLHGLFNDKEIEMLNDIC